MKIGLISDIHANLPALSAVLAALRGMDRILCAGDLTGYYTEPNEVIETLLEHRVETIIGNHDRYLDQPPKAPNPLLTDSLKRTTALITPGFRALLAQTPPQMRLDIDGLRVAMFHGSPWDPLEEYIYPDYPQFERFADFDADVIVLGHTHRPFEHRVAGRLIVNPGGCGQPRDGDTRAACAVLDTSRREVRMIRAAYDASEVLRALRGSEHRESLARYLPPADEAGMH